MIRFRPLPAGDAVRLAPHCEALLPHLMGERIRRDAARLPQRHSNRTEAANRQGGIAEEAVDSGLRAAHLHVRTPFKKQNHRNTSGRTGNRTLLWLWSATHSRQAARGGKGSPARHAASCHYTIATLPAPINQIPRLGLTLKTGKCSVTPCNPEQLKTTYSKKKLTTT